MANVKELEGLQFFGAYAGIDQGSLLLDYTYRSNGNLTSGTRKIAFAPFDSNTGEMTQIGEMVDDLVAGERLAVSVFANVSGRNVSLRASEVLRLDREDSDSRSTHEVV